MASPPPFDYLLETILALTCILIFWGLSNIHGKPWNWPFLGNLPNMLFHVHRIHDRCADVMEFTGGTALLKGPWFANMDLLATVDPANVHYIMSSNFSNFPKGSEFKKIFDVLGDGIFNSDSDSWKDQRKTARALITHQNFHRFLIRTTSDKLEQGLIPILEHFSRNCVTFDLQDLFQRFTFDTTCILVTGFDPGCLSVEFPDVPFAKAMDEAEEAIFMRHCLPEFFWRFQSWLGIGHERKLTEARATLDRVICQYISLKRQEISKKMPETPDEIDDVRGFDLLTSYMSSEEEHSKATGSSSSNDNKFLRDTILNLMLAGRDTTSSALTWFIWLVATHPQVSEKIRAELMNNNNPSPSPETAESGNHFRLFKIEEVKNLVYLHAAICESLRLYPPVPFEHKAPLKPDTLPTGHRVHPKMRIFFSLYAMGRNSAIWGKDCFEFRPERWISADTGRIRHEPSYKFLAFNAGPRSCLGKEVAFTQMKAVAADIIHNYEVQVVEGHVVKPNVSIILYMKHGLKVRVSRRWN